MLRLNLAQCLRRTWEDVYWYMHLYTHSHAAHVYMNEGSKPPGVCWIKKMHVKSTRSLTSCGQSPGTCSVGLSHESKMSERHRKLMVPLRVSLLVSISDAVLNRWGAQPDPCALPLESGSCMTSCIIFQLLFASLSLHASVRTHSSVSAQMEFPAQAKVWKHHQPVSRNPRGHILFSNSFLSTVPAAASVHPSPCLFFLFLGGFFLWLLLLFSFVANVGFVVNTFLQLRMSQTLP